MLESVYRVCLVHELRCGGVRCNAEVPLPIRYRGLELETEYRIDLLVESDVVVELKAVNKLEAVHTAQLITYMKLLKRPVGLLINFNAPLLKEGIRRILLRVPDPRLDP